MLKTILKNGDIYSVEYALKLILENKLITTRHGILKDVEKAKIKKKSLKKTTKKAFIKA